MQHSQKKKKNLPALVEIESLSQGPFVSLQSTEVYLIRFKFFFLNLSSSASQANLCFFYPKAGIKKNIEEGKNPQQQRIWTIH